MTTQEHVGTTQPRTSQEHIELVERTTAHNYHPLPVVVAEAEGAWVTDVEGRRYLDMLAGVLGAQLRAPSSRRLIAAAKEQLDRVTLTEPRLPPRPVRVRSARSSPSCAAWTWCCR